jgi:glycosyltransferase involved in cell wall biosynthesis
MNEQFEPGLVSVIIPTFNRARLLKEALDSVSGQTYRPIEALVVDDGSTDGTKDVFEEWALKIREDKEFHPLYFHQSKSGAPAARNRGLIESHGEFIQFMDSDDLLHPDKVNMQVCALRKYLDCDFVWSDLLEFPDGVKPNRARTSQLVNPAGQLELKKIGADLASMAWMVQGGLYRRRLIQPAGPWNEKLVRWQDIDYAVRLACLGPAYTHLRAALYYFRMHEHGRIQDLYSNRNGVNGGLLALESIERTLARVNNHDPKVARDMSNFYLQLARLAAIAGTPGEVRTAIRGALKHRRSFKFGAKVQIFSALYSFAGGFLADRIFSLYSKLSMIKLRMKGKSGEYYLTPRKWPL